MQVSTITAILHTSYDLFESIASPADYSEFSNEVRFTSETSLSADLLVPTVFDDIDETQETFQVIITGITTECPFEQQNTVATVTIRDRQSELATYYYY